MEASKHLVTGMQNQLGESTPQDTCKLSMEDTCMLSMVCALVDDDSGAGNTGEISRNSGELSVSACTIDSGMVGEATCDASSSRVYSCTMQQEVVPMAAAAVTGAPLNTLCKHTCMPTEQTSKAGPACDADKFLAEQVISCLFCFMLSLHLHSWRDL